MSSNNITHEFYKKHATFKQKKKKTLVSELGTRLLQGTGRHAFIA
jgi:hypothetical protein